MKIPETLLPGTPARKLIDFFASNEDEELDYPTAEAKFGITRKQLECALSRLRHHKLIQSEYIIRPSAAFKRARTES